jgi:hypothetical protein
MRATAAGVLISGLALGCGGPFRRTGVVVSVVGDRICLERPPGDTELRCYVHGKGSPSLDGVRIGDCVHVVAKQESVRITVLDVLPRGACGAR